jgi:hypothetical protein
MLRDLRNSAKETLPSQLSCSLLPFLTALKKRYQPVVLKTLVFHKIETIDAVDTGTDLARENGSYETR